MSHESCLKGGGWKKSASPLLGEVDELFSRRGKSFLNNHPGINSRSLVVVVASSEKHANR